MEAAIELHDIIDPSRIRCGVISIPAPFARVVGTIRPASASTARFSVTYCVATALLDGRLDLDSFNQTMLCREDIADLESKLTVNAYDVPDSIGDLSPNHPDQVSVHSEDGVEHKRSRAEVKGSRNNPVDQAILRHKFGECAGVAFGSGDHNRLFEVADQSFDGLSRMPARDFLTLAAGHPAREQGEHQRCPV